MFCTRSHTSSAIVRSLVPSIACSHRPSTTPFAAPLTSRRVEEPHWAHVHAPGDDELKRFLVVALCLSAHVFA